MTKLKEQTFHLIGKEFNTEDLLRIFKPETEYQIDRLAMYLRDFIGKPLKLVITRTRRPKSAEALGMYFGAIVPAVAMDILDLSYDVEKIYSDYRYYRDIRKITQKQLSLTDKMLRLEWHYEYTRTIEGNFQKIPKDLATQDNGALLMLIDKVMEWRAQQGYPYIDIEKYKELKNSAELRTE